MKRILAALATAAFATMAFAQAGSETATYPSGWATGPWAQDYAFIAPAQ